MKENRGFTLIELLVVIAIIALLSSIVLASLNSARAKSRDAQRRSDLHQLQVAVELYYDKNGSYIANSGVYTVSATLTPLVPTFIPGMPHDPKPLLGGDYFYSSAGGATGYLLMTYLEKTGSYCRILSGAENPATGWASLPPC
jgi:prepilin-type N-terminal cleavage/methylation domain-containing protein